MKIPIVIKKPEEILENVKNGLFDVLDNEENNMERDDISNEN